MVLVSGTAKTLHCGLVRCWLTPSSLLLVELGLSILCLIYKIFSIVQRRPPRVTWILLSVFFEKNTIAFYDKCVSVFEKLQLFSNDDLNVFLWVGGQILTHASASFGCVDAISNIIPI